MFEERKFLRISQISADFAFLHILKVGENVSLSNWKVVLLCTLWQQKGEKNVVNSIQIAKFYWK